jgi:hypothetical protein
MIDVLPFLKRRRLLGLLAGLPVAGQPGGARAMRAALASPVFSDPATILVAGPEGATLDRWGRVLAPALAQNIAPEITLRRSTVGAPDGVTGANQFGARAAPDGETVLLAPGDAVLAWLVGDPRAQYDVARWISVSAALSHGIVMARAGTLVPGQHVRLPSSNLAGSDLPAALGLELLGLHVEPVLPLADDALPGAIAQGAVDAVFLRGHKVVDQARVLAAAGARPVFALGALDPNGRVMRSPAFLDVPTLAELYPTLHGETLGGPLYAAWCAAAIAAQLEFVLVLPQLTPAAMVSLWRRAAGEAVATIDVQSLAQATGVRTLGGTEATATTGATAADQATLLALRGWLTARFNWKPA